MERFEVEKLSGNCEHCGASITFLPSQPRRFCSVACYRATHRADRGVCLGCGGEVIHHPSKRHKFCSKECYWANRDKSGRATMRRRNAAPRQTVECLVCHKNFACRDDQPRKTCSLACKHELLAREHAPKLCTQCGKTFRKRSPSKTQKAQFCSQQCFADYRSSLPERIHKPCERCGTIMILLPCYSERRFCSQKCNTSTVASMRIVNPPIVIERKRAAYQARRTFPLRCAICGWEEDVDICHIVASHKGGEHDRTNLVPLCPNHHRMFDRGRLSVRQVRAARQRLLASLQPEATVIDQVVEQLQLC